MTFASRLNRTYVLIFLLQIFCSVDVAGQTPGLTHDFRFYSFIGNYRISTAGVGVSDFFCRPAFGNLGYYWPEEGQTHVLTPLHFLSASAFSGTPVYFPGSLTHLIRHEEVNLRHISQKGFLENSGCSAFNLNRDNYIDLFRVSESPDWYFVHLQSDRFGGHETYFQISDIHYDMRIGSDEEWTSITSTNQNNSYNTDGGVSVNACLQPIGSQCPDISTFDLLKFRPKYIPDMGVNGSTNYQIRMRLDYDCSDLSDTLVYNFAVFEKIKNIDFTITQPCAAGNTTNGSVTLDFYNRTGGKYKGRYAADTMKVSDFSFTLTRDATLNGVYDECGTQTYPITNSTQTFDNLPMGDYLLKVECIHPDFDYGYIYYDTISIYPRVAEIGFEEKYFICDKNVGVTLSLPTNTHNKKWTSSCYSIVQDTLLTQTFKQGTNIIATATTTNGCSVVDTTRIVDLTGFVRQLNILDSVISISASEYSSNWPPAYMQMSWDTEADLYHYRTLPPYQKGSAGIYRPVHAYDYLDNRVQTKQSNLPKVNLKRDGIINDVKFFDWMYGADSTCLPEWILNATMTQYNSSGFDIENKDIFDIYSSALYGYKNQLPIAVSANAKAGEIGFESFEEYTSTSELHQLNNASGNIDLVPVNIAANSERTQRFPILIGQGNYALVDMKSFQESNLCSDGWMDADVYVMIPDPLTGKVSDFTLSARTKIVGAFCNSDFVIIEFPGNIPDVFSPNECHHWRGELMLKEQVAMTGYKLLNHLSISDTKAHTGKRSLHVAPVPQSGEEPLRISSRQHKMKLEHGKKYHISAWIHHAQMNNYTTSALEGYHTNNGIGLNIHSGENEYFFQPSGKVINGWQKITAAFIHTGRESYVDFLFTNQQEMYLDDIRIFPEDGNLQTYVYDPSDYRLRAVLDANNFATIYIYDAEGRVYAVKNETEEGILTLQQSSNYIRKNP